MSEETTILELNILIEKAKLLKAEFKYFTAIEFTPEEDKTISAADNHVNKFIGALIHLAKLKRGERE